MATERVVEFLPFEFEQKEDGEWGLCITALVAFQDEMGGYLIADYPLTGVYAGERFVSAFSWTQEGISRLWTDITHHPAPDFTEVTS